MFSNKVTFVVVVVSLGSLTLCSVAFLFYLGLRSLVVGLSVYCSGSGPEWQRANEMQQKMKS